MYKASVSDKRQVLFHACLDKYSHESLYSIHGSQSHVDGIHGGVESVLEQSILVAAQCGKLLTSRGQRLVDKMLIVRRLELGNLKGSLRQEIADGLMAGDLEWL
jgi:hypothetical protein